MRKRVVIATIKSWNLQKAYEFKTRHADKYMDILRIQQVFDVVAFFLLKFLTQHQICRPVDKAVSKSQ